MTAPIGFEIGPPPPSKVEPTVEGRIPAYDFIRGVAILGILLANIPAFAGPSLGEMLTGASPVMPQDEAVAAWTGVLVTGKFRSMLAILFGIGIWLQFRKRSEVPGNWPGGYLKRAMILMFFGLVHAVLIWYGDILFLYSLVAFLACLMAGFSDRVLIWLASLSGGLAVLGGLAMTLAAQFVSPADMKGFIPDGAIPELLRTPSELAIYQSGSFLDQLQHRLHAFGFLLSSLLVFIPILGGLFLFGILLGKYGVLAQPSAHPTLVRRFLWLGLGFGIPLAAAVEFFVPPHADFLAYQAVEILYGPLTATGLIMLLAIAAERGLFASAQKAIERVGRTAFSNYILQSLLGTAIFYSWGGGLFGDLNRLEMLAVVPAIWGANLVFSHFWLGRFRMGPLEWLWRSLTEGRKIELRRRTGSEVKGPGFSG